MTKQILSARQLPGLDKSFFQSIHNLTSQSRAPAACLRCGLILVFMLALTACSSLPTLSVFPSDSPTRALPAPTTPPQPGITLKPSPTAAAPITPQPTPAATLDVQPARLQGQTVRFWYLLPESTHLSGEKDLIQAAAADFQASNPWGLRVEGTPYVSPDDLYQALQTAPSTGLPDLLMLYPFQAAQLRESGQGLVDLTPYLSDPQWGLPPEQSQMFYPNFWNLELENGELTGIPFSLVPQVLLYNQTWASELGFSSAPDTAQAFRTQSCQAAGGEQPPGSGLSNRPGGWAIDSSAAVLLSWMEAFGIDIVAPTRQGYAFSTSQVTDLFTFLRSLYDDGCAWKPGELPPVQEFAQRKALFISLPLSGLPALEDAFAQAQNKDRWTVLPYPSPKGKSAFSTSGSFWSITRSQPERQLAAWLLLKGLVAPELQAAWASAYSTWPGSASAQLSLADFRGSHPAWGASLDLLPAARPEPSLASWDAVRWALSDAGDRLFSATFYAQQIPLLVKMLDDTARELGGLIR